MPRSLFGRLLGIAAVTIIAALAFAAFAIGHILERFVIHGLDQQLDAQIGLLTKAVRADGTLDQARVFDLPAFDEPASAWSWQVDGSGGRRWTRGATIESSDRAPPPIGRDRGEQQDRRAAAMPHPGEGRARSGEIVHFRRLVVQTSQGPVVVTAAGPRQLALRPLREAMVPLLGSLALLGGALALATLLQLRFGLRPLQTLRGSLADVRAGRARHIPLDQPDELAPLAAELNALIDQNEAGLAHARRHLANLAHGLKTPLAALAVRLAESGRDEDGGLADMVSQIDRRVRHHLGRARAAAPGGGQRFRTLLGPAIADLRRALEHIHAETALTVFVDVAAEAAVMVDPEDLDEMIGNLLDNAWRHARTTITMGATKNGSIVMLTIDDDGPGLDPRAMSEALVPGRRLDERGDGHGFGLSIAQELAELNGGGLMLEASPLLPGLRARLTLPAST